MQLQEDELGFNVSMGASPLSAAARSVSPPAASRTALRSPLLTSERSVRLTGPPPCECMPLRLPRQRLLEKVGGWNSAHTENSYAGAWGRAGRTSGISGSELMGIPSRSIMFSSRLEDLNNNVIMKQRLKKKKKKVYPERNVPCAVRSANL